MVSQWQRRGWHVQPRRTCSPRMPARPCTCGPAVVRMRPALETRTWPTAGRRIVGRPGRRRSRRERRWQAASSLPLPWRPGTPWRVHHTMRRAPSGRLTGGAETGCPGGWADACRGGSSPPGLAAPLGRL
eukprot:1713073-Prymnesium_polylepis.2